jgi:hypothetical protein
MASKSKKQDPLDLVLDAIGGGMKKHHGKPELHWYTWPLVSFIAYAFICVWFDGWLALTLGFTFLIGQYLVRGSWWRYNRIRLLADNGLPDPGLWRLIKDRNKEFGKIKKTKAAFEIVCRSERLQGKDDNKSVPTLLNMRTTANMDIEADVVTAHGNGITINDIQQHASRFAEVAGADGGFVVRRTGGVSNAKLTWYFTDPMERVLPLSDLPDAQDGRLSYGVRLDGSASSIEMGLSLLIGGLTRHGKSNAVWALLAYCNKHRIPIDLYVSDPKEGMELKQLGLYVGKQMNNLKVIEYVTDPDGEPHTAAMVQRAEEAMRERMRNQTKGNWKISTDNPLTVILLDELLPLTEMIAQKNKGSLGKIMYVGSGAGFCVWANAQIGHEAVTGVLRNFIPQRICFRTKTSQTTDTILGTGAETRGAKCSEISERGIGYAEDEFSNRLDKFRGALVTDEQKVVIAKGEVPDGMFGKVEEVNPQHAVYRFFNRERELLYVGETNSPKDRFKQHAAEQPWWHEVDMRLTKITWWDSRVEGEAEEARAIKAELPKYNILLNQDNPLRVVVRKQKRNQPELEAVEPDGFVQPAGEWPLPDSVTAPPALPRTSRWPSMPHRNSERTPKPARVKTAATAGPDYLPWEN